jgi:hypothetical protein
MLRQLNPNVVDLALAVVLVLIGFVILKKLVY